MFWFFNQILTFSNFSSRFLIPNIFFQFEFFLSFSRTLKHFFLTVGQNNFDNKIPFSIVSLISSLHFTFLFFDCLFHLFLISTSYHFFFPSKFSAVCIMHYDTDLDCHVPMWPSQSSFSHQHTFGMEWNNCTNKVRLFCCCIAVLQMLIQYFPHFWGRKKW